MGTWTNNNYKSISIVNGTDSNNPDLMLWLSQNATYQPIVYTITPALAHLSSSNTDYTILQNETWTTTLTAEEGYSLPNLVSISNVTVDFYDAETGELVLSNPTDNITLNLSAIPGTVLENKALVTFEDLEIFKNKMLDIILNYKGGYYDRNEVYELGDIVFYQKRIYVCIQQTPSDIPPTNENYWEPIDIAAEAE